MEYLFLLNRKLFTKIIVLRSATLVTLHYYCFASFSRSSLICTSVVQHIYFTLVLYYLSLFYASFILHKLCYTRLVIHQFCVRVVIHYSFIYTLVVFNIRSVLHKCRSTTVCSTLVFCLFLQFCFTLRLYSTFVLFLTGFCHTSKFYTRFVLHQFFFTHVLNYFSSTLVSVLQQCCFTLMPNFFLHQCYSTLVCFIKGLLYTFLFYIS